jgi:hypothetical protein
MGGKVVYLNYNGQKKITLQTPELSAPFGLSTYTDEGTGVVKYSLDISFRGMDSNDKIKMFYEKMSEVDEYVINYASEHSKEWWGKKMSKEVVEELYRPSIKPAKDPEKYAPTMKFKIMTRDDDMNVLAFNTKKEPFNLSEIGSGAAVSGIIEASSIWFVNKQFGISWRIIQAMVNQPELLNSCAFVDSDIDTDDDDDDNAEEPAEDEAEVNDEEEDI